MLSNQNKKVNKMLNGCYHLSQGSQPASQFNDFMQRFCARVERFLKFAQNEITGSSSCVYVLPLPYTDQCLDDEWAEFIRTQLTHTNTNIYMKLSQ